MTPLTAAQVAEARRSWQAVLKLEKEKPSSQAIAIALWACVWTEKLLAAAEILTNLHDAVRVPRTFPQFQQPRTPSKEQIPTSPPPPARDD